MVRSRCRVATTALIVLGALLGVGLGGCGTTAKTPRTQTAAYLKRVNAVEKQLNKPLLDVSRAGARFAHQRQGGTGSLGGLVSAPDVMPLQTDLRRIRALRAQLAAIPAPVPVTTLRGLLLRLIDRQAYLTQQTIELERFLPGFNIALGPLVPASKQLEQVLRISSGYGTAAVQSVYVQKATALKSFQHTLQGVLDKLRRLRAPAVSRPSYRAQFEAVQGMSSSAGKLAVALVNHDATAVPVLLAAFNRAAATPRTLGVQRAQIAAAKAYNRTAGQLSALATQAARERLRLSNSLR
jgi:hypothetical protein